MHLEIELRSSHLNQDIHELRNYLQEQIPGLDITMKVIPAEEGQMVDVAVIGMIVTGIVEAVAGETIHELYNRLLKPKIANWLKAKHIPTAQSLEVLSTLKTEDSRVHFSQSSTGESKVYDNVNYAIEPDKTYAILIGASEFEGGFTPIPPVKGNIEDLYHLLTDKRHIGLPRENVIVAHNKSNTEIEEILLRNSRRPDMETLIVYYTGHGHRTDVKKLFLIASNTKRIDDYILGGIDFDFIQNAILRPSTARQKILILDACHSGIATQGSESLATEIDVKGTYILTSSPGDEVSYFDKKGRNTYFTGALLDVLNKGIDNTNEMLALDDLYDQAHTQLQEKNFPQPISKSQLNIPASQFFIARNPAFSTEKLKRRPAILYSQGKHQDALYEYELLTQKYPDDLQLRKEAEQCRSQVLFTQLVNDADELFYQYNNYPDALEKYRKALLVKSDDMVRNKISKCEERLRSNPSTEGKSSSQHKKQNSPTSEYQPQQKTKPDSGTTSSPRQSIKQEQSVKKEQPPHATQPAPTGSKIAIIIAIIWMLLMYVVYLSPLRFYWGVWYLPTLPILIVTAILFGARLKKMSNTEFLLYVYAVLPVIWHVVSYFLGMNSILIPLLALICAVGLFRLLKKRITDFNVAQCIFGGLALIFLSVVVGGVAFFEIAQVIDPNDRDEYGFTGLSLGGLTGLGLVIYLIVKWRRPKPSIPADASTQVP